MWHVALVILAASLWPSLGYRSRVRRESDHEIQLRDDEPKYIEEGFYGENKTYEDDTDFTWKVHVPDQGYTILLTSLTFVLEYSYHCGYDFVEIFDGEKTANHSVGKFCGFQDVRLISQHGQIFVHFRSDSSVTASGFLFELRRVPAEMKNMSGSACNRTISSSTGTLLSEGYHEGRYPANTSCFYRIKGSENNRINLTFDEFWLERGDCSFGDYLTVYDGRTSAVEIGRYCGKAAPLYILSSSSELLLYFHSNGLFITEKGFKLTYRQLAKGGATTYEVVDREHIPEDDSDCSHLITTLGRNVTSPKWKGDHFYLGKRECKTVIEAPPGQEVILHFVNFDLEDSVDCMYDHVNVTYKLDDDTPFTVRLCGYHRYHSLCFRSADNRTTLDFRSDHMYEREGYMATYEFLSANDTKNCSSAIIPEGNCAGYWYDNGNGLACACPTQTVPPDCTQNITWTKTLRENFTTFEGNTHSFSCGINHPHPLITWEFNLLTLPDPNKRHISVHRNGTLILSKVASSDTGVYSCFVQAGSWIERMSINFKVKREVEFCGRASENIIDPNKNVDSAKVAGTNSSKVPDFIPWQAILWNRKEGEHYCGGVLISELFVLTAAHCISGPKAKANYKDLVVSFGTKGCRNEGIEKRNISRYILHPENNHATLQYDLALLELDTPVTTLSNRIYPICLSSSDKLWSKSTPGTRGLIAGCGKDSKGDFPPTMHMVTIPLLDNKKCANARKDFFSDMFCGGEEGKGSVDGDACSGDSGGAIAVKFEDRWTLLGLISFGNGCAGNEYGFYSNVSKAKDWIEEYAGSCGRSRVRDIQGNVEDSRIYRGDDARPGQFPWATRMVIGPKECERICGATLINSKWLITAEHCTIVRKYKRGECTTGSKIKKDKQMKKVTIVAGTVTINKTESTRRELKIVNITRHPSEDLALLELSEPVQFNDFIQPACLPRGEIILGDGQKGTLAAWGYKIKGNKTVADHLQFAEFEKKDQAFCEEQWKQENFSVRTCFGGEDRAKAYKGDSGSGIGWENAGVFTLDGIYLAGSSDKGANYNKTGIFVDVSKYLPWILKKMKWES